MSETGVVISVHGDQAIVEMEASRECEACGACRYTSTGRMVAPVRNSLDARVGDTVKIDIEPQLVIAAALIVYILPIAFFFVGYTLFFWLAGQLNTDRLESAGIAGGLGFLVLSYFSVRVVDRRARISRRFEPKMYDIIRENSPGR